MGMLLRWAIEIEFQEYEKKVSYGMGGVHGQPVLGSPTDSAGY